jgi:hypothetical protein
MVVVWEQAKFVDQIECSRGKLFEKIEIDFYWDLGKEISIWKSKSFWDF